MVQIIQKEIHNPLSNFLYLIKFREFENDKHDTYIAIDPYDADLVINEMKNNSKEFKLKYIINTHSHNDHIRGNQGLLNAFNDLMLINIQNYADLKLTKDHYLKLFPITGHTLDHLGVYLHEKEKLHAFFSGDTLFYAGVGNVKNGGDLNLLFKSIQKIVKEVPDDTLIYPGHNYLEKNLEFALFVDQARDDLKEKLLKIKKGVALFPLTMREVKDINIFLKDISSFEVFKDLRLKRDKF